MTEKEALISLNLADIGSVRLRRLLEYFKSAKDILEVQDREFISLGISSKLISKIIRAKNADFRKEKEEAERLGIEIITLFDEGYPEQLRQIYDPPIVLYVMGSLHFDVGLSIVGCRRASFYGLSSAEKISRELSALGITVISGLARGIDTAAHKGALAAGGKTIAVLGSGLKNIYPPENEALAHSIAQKGAVISEFPLDTQPYPYNFPRRNRIISGLSAGVVVVEAAQNSGALITADFALEQGREVYALPGKVDSPTSYGTNDLIKQGAKLVTNVADILEELNLNTQPNCIGKTADMEAAEAEVSLEPEEENIFNLLNKGPMNIDEMIDNTKFTIPRLNSLLVSLEIKKKIKRLSGQQFVRR